MRLEKVSFAVKKPLHVCAMEKCYCGAGSLVGSAALLRSGHPKIESQLEDLFQSHPPHSLSPNLLPVITLTYLNKCYWSLL